MTNKEIIYNVATVCSMTGGYCEIANSHTSSTNWICKDCEREMIYAKRRDLIRAIRSLIQGEKI